MIKEFFIDLETTGLDFVKNGVHQISGVLKIDGEEKMFFDYDVNVFEGDVINNKAMEISGKTPQQLELAPPPRDIFRKIFGKDGLGRYVNAYDQQDKMFFVAYNSHFDNGFLRAWFNKL